MGRSLWRERDSLGCRDHTVCRVLHRDDGGKTDGDRRAAAERALDMDRAAVALDDRLADRQADPDARDLPLARCRGADELGEEVPELRLGDADPAVVHGYDGMRV